VTDAIVALIEGALSSPWGLLGLAVVAAVDGFFPVVPSESILVTAGAFAAGGDQSLIAAGALGAFTGDHHNRETIRATKKACICRPFPFHRGDRFKSGSEQARNRVFRICFGSRAGARRRVFRMAQAGD
jgi:hypothetical protein